MGKKFQEKIISVLAPGIFFCLLIQGAVSAQPEMTFNKGEDYDIYVNSSKESPFVIENVQIVALRKSEVTCF